MAIVFGRDKNDYGKRFNRLANWTLDCGVSKLEEVVRQSCKGTGEMQIEELEKEKFLIHFHQNDKTVILGKRAGKQITIFNDENDEYFTEKFYRYGEQSKKWYFERVILTRKVIARKENLPEKMDVKLENSNIHFEIMYENKNRVFMHFKQGKNFDEQTYFSNNKDWPKCFFTILENKNALEIYGKLCGHPFFIFKEIEIKTLDEKEENISIWKRVGKKESFEMIFEE